MQTDNEYPNYSIFGRKAAWFFTAYFFSRVQTTQKIVENSRTHDRQYGNDASHAGTGGEKNVHAFNIDIRNDGQEEDDDTIGQPSTNVIDDAKDATSWFFRAIKELWLLKA